MTKHFNSDMLNADIHGHKYLFFFVFKKKKTITHLLSVLLYFQCVTLAFSLVMNLTQ